MAEEGKQTIEKDVSNLQRSVVALVADSNKRWYRNPTLWLSILALAVSIFFSFCSILNQLSEDKQKAFQEKMQLLRATVEKIVDNRIDIDAANAGHDLTKQATYPSRNEKQNLWYETAKALVNQLRDSISAATYLDLGLEMDDVSRYAEAVDYLR